MEEENKKNQKKEDKELDKNSRKEGENLDEEKTIVKSIEENKTAKSQRQRPISERASSRDQNKQGEEFENIINPRQDFAVSDEENQTEENEKTNAEQLENKSIKENLGEEAKKHEEEIQKEEVNKVKNDQVIADIMVGEEHRKEEIMEKNERKFEKKTLIRREPFSWGNLDVYLHVKYANVSVLMRCLIECILIILVFMIWPIITLFYCDLKRTYSFWEVLQTGQKFNLLTEFVRSNLFVSLTYVVFIGASLIFDNLLYTCAYFLNTFGIPVQGAIAETLQILSQSKRHLRNMIVSLITFMLAVILLSKYVWFAKIKDLTHIFLTCIFWFACVSAILFVESFAMNLLTSELRRKSFRGRIWDANYKTFLLKKLAAIAEATPRGGRRVREIARGMINDYDTGFFLRHNDLDISTQDAASMVAESIFGYLDIEELTFEDIAKYFPENEKEVYCYFNGYKLSELEDKGKSDDMKSTKQCDAPPISFETFEGRCIELSQERMDISRSVYDRDNILRKLDLILIGIVGFFGIIIFFILLDVDYKIYVASIGPTVFGFGWIFQDSIKELYRCFVFHLINHPFDCGDRVVIDGEEMVVLRIDLMYTTYTTVLGKVKYVPNAAMFMKNVENIRRSDLQSEFVNLTVKNTTTFNDIIETKQKIADWLKLNTKDFSGQIYIKNYEPCPPNIRVVFSIEHSSNFQDSMPRYLKRESLIKAMDEILNNLGVSFDRNITFSE